MSLRTCPFGPFCGSPGVVSAPRRSRAVAEAGSLVNQADSVLWNAIPRNFGDKPTYDRIIRCRTTQSHCPSRNSAARTSVNWRSLCATTSTPPEQPSCPNVRWTVSEIRRFAVATRRLALGGPPSAANPQVSSSPTDCLSRPQFRSRSGKGSEGEARQINENSWLGAQASRTSRRETTTHCYAVRLSHDRLPSSATCRLPLPGACRTTRGHSVDVDWSEDRSSEPTTPRARRSELSSPSSSRIGSVC